MNTNELNWIELNRATSTWQYYCLTQRPFVKFGLSGTEKTKYSNEMGH